MTAVPHSSPSLALPATGGAAPAACGLLSAGLFVASAVAFADALGGSDSAQQAADSLAASGGRVVLAVTLLTVSALLACAVVASLGARAVGARTLAGRLVVPFGMAHFLLAAAAFWPLAGAVTVGEQIFDTGVSPVGAEIGLISLNALQPLAALVGAGFLAAVATAGRGGVLARWVVVTAAVLGLGLLLPPVSWAVVYLLPLWVAAVGIALWRSPEQG